MLTTVAAGRVYDYGYCIGMYSQSGRGFWAPQDFVLGPSGRMYVLSRGVEQLGQRVSKLSVDIEGGHEFQGQFGSVGAEDGRFVWPRSIDLDPRGRVFVSDEYINRITIYDEEGAYRYHWGRSGSEEGLLNGPSGIAFDSRGTLWVVDSLNHRVQNFSQIGEFKSRFGKQGGGDGELEMPWGLCVDRQDNIYVADWGNNRVQKFSPAGELLVKFEGNSAGVGSLKGPSGVAVDSDGDVYVTDWGNHRVQIYAADGQYITALVGDAQELSPWAQAYVDANPDLIKARRRTDLEPEWRFPAAGGGQCRRRRPDHSPGVLPSPAANLQQAEGLRGTLNKPVGNCSLPPLRAILCAPGSAVSLAVIVERAIDPVVGNLDHRREIFQKVVLQELQHNLVGGYGMAADAASTGYGSCSRFENSALSQ